MKVHSISLHCPKNLKFGNAESSENSNTQRKRYKHIEKLDNDSLFLRSILKANKDVENSNKARLFKAMPKVAAGVLTTSIALTQPGKLSAKAATGVGFLVAANALNKTTNVALVVANEVNKQKTDDKNPQKRNIINNIAALAGAVTACAIGAAISKKAVGKIFNSNLKAAEFAKNEVSNLANEINNTKIGKFVAEKVMPFEQKHTKALSRASIVAPMLTVFGYAVGENKLAKDISNDIKTKTCENFAKGKRIQEIAQQEFDKIDATEV